ncbi:MAG: DUF4870 domain-containing protein [Chloroflexi bacterium]|nr:DUF4870 domain-containing protein [Chloroflexota bacterium]
MTDELHYTDADTERVSRLKQATQENEVVREYEQKYYEPRKLKVKPRSYSTMNISDEERQWAMLAHASIWLTLVGGFLTAGFVVPLSIFVPLVVYFLYRKRSDYVAFHALQAFVLQLIATVGVLALAVVGGTAWLVGMVIALLAVFVLAGIVLVPLWGLVGIALALVLFLTPFAALLLGTIAAVQTYNRLDYRYPFIAKWVDRQLAGGFLNVV